jgi:hypothetical protein
MNYPSRSADTPAVRNFIVPLDAQRAIETGTSVLKDELEMVVDGDAVARQSFVGWCLPQLCSRSYTIAFFERFLNSVIDVSVQIHAGSIKFETRAQTFAFNAIVEYAQWWAENTFDDVQAQAQTDSLRRLGNAVLAECGLSAVLDGELRDSDLPESWFETLQK